jgi:hypothetical protein
MIKVDIRELAGEVFSAFNTPFLDGLETIELRDDGSVIISGVIDVEASSTHPGDVKIEARSSFSFTLEVRPDGETNLKLPDQIEVETTITRTKVHRREDIPGG